MQMELPYVVRARIIKGRSYIRKLAGTNRRAWTKAEVKEKRGVKGSGKGRRAI